jgi:hypothetical protein
VRVKALFENHQFRFVLTNLDQYVGDAATIRFEVVGGVLPLTADFPRDQSVGISLGSRILTGPTKTSIGAFPYLYVVDQGQPLTRRDGRGQFLRLNPRHGSRGLPRFDSNSTKDRFHIQ